MSRILHLFLVVAALTGTLTSGAPSVFSRTIDVVLLKDGTRLPGILLPDAEHGSQVVSLLMRAAWLNEHEPGLVSSRAEALGIRERATSLLENHIADLEASPNPLAERIGFLRTRLVEVRAIEAKPRLGELAVLQIAEQHVRRIHRQPSRIRHLGFLGIINQLPSVESLSRRDVQKKIGAIPRSNLTTSLPQTRDAETSSLFDCVRLNADLEFGPVCRMIQVGNEFIDADSEQNPVRLTTRILTQQLRLVAAELTDESRQKSAAARHRTTLPPAVRIAASEKKAVIVILTDWTMHLKNGVAEVLMTLFHRDQTQLDRFRIRRSVTGNASIADVSAERQELIGRDPRVKQVLDLFGNLGTGNSDVARALAMGAVVDTARQNAELLLQETLPSVMTLANRPVVDTIRIDELPSALR